MWDKNLSPSQYSNRKGIAIKPAPSATFLLYYFPMSSFNLHAVHLSLPYNICGGTKLKAQEPGQNFFQQDLKALLVSMNGLFFYFFPPFTWFTIKLLISIQISLPLFSGCLSALQTRFIQSLSPLSTSSATKDSFHFLGKFSHITELYKTQQQCQQYLTLSNCSSSHAHTNHGHTCHCGTGSHKRAPNKSSAFRCSSANVLLCQHDFIYTIFPVK